MVESMLYNTNTTVFVHFFQTPIDEGSICNLLGNHGLCTDTEMGSPFPLIVMKHLS